MSDLINVNLTNVDLRQTEFSGNYLKNINKKGVIFAELPHKGHNWNESIKTTDSLDKLEKADLEKVKNNYLLLGDLIEAIKFYRAKKSTELAEARLSIDCILTQMESEI